MSEKPYAGEAGPVTPVDAALDPFVGQRDYYRVKVLMSEHQKEVAKTHAWTGVVRLAILAFVVGVVLVCAMALGVPPPWELALSLVLGKAPGQ